MDLSAVAGSLLGTTTTAPPTVRRPDFKISFSSGGSGGSSSGGLGGLAGAAGSALGLDSKKNDPWKSSVVTVAVNCGLAPTVNVAEVVLASGPEMPGVALGDTGSIALGYEDSPPVTVFTGMVARVAHTLHGLTRLTVTDGGAALATLRLNQSYEQQTAGDIVGDLAGRVSVATDTLESGSNFPFYVLDDRRSAYAHLAALARKCNFLAYITPDGKLSFAPYSPGEPVQTFNFGDDIIALEMAEANPSAGEITVYGEGAAGSQGSDAWNWLVKDPSAVSSSAGSGDPTRVFADRSLRSADATQSSATGASDAAARVKLTGTLVTTGAPAVQVGKTIAIKGVPQDTLNGTFLVRGVRFLYSKRTGFSSLLVVAKAGDGSAGGLGGLASLASSLSPF